MPDQIPVECAGIQANIDNMKRDFAEFERELKSDPDINKTLLLRGIAKLNQQIAEANNDLAACVLAYQVPPPPGIPAECAFIQLNIDNLKNDLAEYQRELKTDPDINKDLLMKGIAKLNEEISDAEAALAACIANPPTQAPPTTRPRISGDSTPQPVRKIIPWDLLQKKIDAFFNKRTDPPIFKIRFHHHDHFTGNGDPDNDPPSSDVTISMIKAEVLGGQVTNQYKRLSYIDLGQLDDDYYFNDLSSRSITVGLDPSSSEPLTIRIDFECDGPTEVPTTNHLLPDLDMLEFYVTLKLSFERARMPNDTGRLEFLSWTDKIKDLQDDEFDQALEKYIGAHITSRHSYDIGGTFQGKLREKIYGRLAEGTTRAMLNNSISRWILGGDGSYDVTSFVNDGQNVTINYLVPTNRLDPFPDSMFRPAGWPFAGNPHPTIKFPLHKKLKDIEHIVVLTMENRSFDQMLGYLSLSTSAGGRGRKDVDGLDKAKPNFFDGTNYPVFPFNAGDTAFSTDPSHGYEPVFRQINADVGTPGSGRMDGFVKSFTIDALAGNAGRVMGYHTAANVPAYDLLARDFGISHRWFASHPGPTFCNRFYELTGRLNLASGLSKDLPSNWWEFSNSSPLTPVFNKTIFDHLSEYSSTTDQTVTWKYYEHGYCFLRFFSKYTFNNTNIFSIDDPLNGFFTDAKNGTLPSVSFIDPHFIELPPKANCDGPVADIKAGQDLVRKIVEAVVMSPKFSNTLLIIIYDEHGGFYDHVPPPPATPFSDDSPVRTYGVRVPAFFISPRVKAGSVFGHDADSKGQTLYFDHTSILKTIASRFMSKNPPYLGARYAAATDLTEVLENSPRKSQFLPFVKYSLTYNASGMNMNVEGGNPLPGPITARLDLTNTDDQRFSFEQAGAHIYIRTHCGSLYVTVDVPNGDTAHPPAQGFSIKQDVKYDDWLAVVDPRRFNAKFQQWKFTPLGTSEENKDLYIITSDYYPNRILQPLDDGQHATALVLAPKPKNLSRANAWKVSGPFVSN